MSLRQRLRRLERGRPAGSPTLGLVCVDEEGRVLDDGSVGVRPWIGRHYGAIPRIGQLIVGIDPLQVLGHRPAEPNGASSRLADAERAGVLAA